eukprot:2387741-Alexandrium_andersonii.AAC.1
MVAELCGDGALLRGLVALRAAVQVVFGAKGGNDVFRRCITYGAFASVLLARCSGGLVGSHVRGSSRRCCLQA